MTTERERIRGVSQPLPDGERVLWQGSPRWTSLARHALRAPLWMTYFAIIIAAGLVGALRDHVAPADIVGTLALQAGLSAVVIAGVYAYCVFTSRATVYAVTDRRVVLRIGLVVPTTVNIPMRLVDAAACRVFPDGTGEIALTVRKPDRLGYFHLWPHVRPWHVRWPEPALRAIDDPSRVIAILRELAEHDSAIDLPTATAVPANGTPRVVTAPALLTPVAAGQEMSK